MVLFTRWVAFVMVLLLVSACGAPGASAPTTLPATPAASTLPTTNAPANKIAVVATYSILGDMVKQVGGDLIDLTVLVGPGGDAHTYQPTPQDSAALAKAALIFENGLGFEGWLEDLISASGTSARRVVVTDKITPRKGEGHNEAEAHAAEGTPAAEGEAHNEAEDGEFDPHVWHDPSNGVLMVAAIRDGLVAADPAHKAAYEQQATAYIAQIDELDVAIKAEVAKLPAERRKLVTSHDTFGYFAQHYGFTIVGTAFASVSTEGGDPSGAQLAALVEAIKAAGVPAIFAENVSNPKLVEQMAAEAQVKVGPSLYTDALGEPGSAGDSYLKMLRYNATAIITALRG